MNVTEALTSRLSVRDFLPTPVPAEVIRRVLATASHAPPRAATCSPGTSTWWPA